MDGSCSIAQRDDCEPLQDISVENGIVFEYPRHKYTKERACSEYIRSWAGVTRGVDAMEINYRSVSSETALKFEIVSARTVITVNQKYVAYTVMVTMAGAEEDPYPAVVERRYTDFLKLYTSLKRDFPELLQTVQFPKKALVGNFSPETISGRSDSFEQFLEIIGSTTQVRTSAQVTDFLQRQELTFALKLIKDEDYKQASTLIENCFRIMNKLQTDRSIVVLQNLCLLICIYEKLDNSKAMDLACLAVRRFQGVSDSDLLRYYVPLLNISLELSRKYGKDSAMHGLQERLTDLRTRGIALHDSTSLLTLLMDDLCPSVLKEWERKRNPVGPAVLTSQPSMKRDPYGQMYCYPPYEIPTNFDLEDDSHHLTAVSSWACPKPC